MGIRAMLDKLNFKLVNFNWKTYMLVLSIISTNSVVNTAKFRIMYAWKYLVLLGKRTNKYK